MAAIGIAPIFRFDAGPSTSYKSLMLSPISRCRRLPVSLIAPIQLFAVTWLLSACAAETPWRTPITTASASDAQTSTECSLVGRLACATMAVVTFEGSDSQQATCTASRSGGTYIETCGTATAAPSARVAPTPPAPPKPQVATANTASPVRGSVQLSWKDNSNNENGFIIERCDQVLGDTGSAKMPAKCAGTWKTVGNVAANVTNFVDNTVTANQTYIYRVKATNQSGSSAYTPEAVITAPVR